MRVPFAARRTFLARRRSRRQVTPGAAKQLERLAKEYERQLIREASSKGPVTPRSLRAADRTLSRIGELLEAGETAFAEAVQSIDSHLRGEIERLDTSRKQVAQLAAGDSMVLPAEVIPYLDRLREMGMSERLVEGQRDGWILLAALARPDPRVDARETRGA